MTEMDLIRIREELHRLTLLAGEWTPDGITALERDLALGKLRELYDVLRFAPTGEIRTTEAPADEEMPLSISLDEVLLAGAPSVDPEREPFGEEPDPAAEPEPEMPVSESVVELVAEPEAEPEPIVSEPEISEVEVKVPESVPAKPLEQALFGLEEIEQHKRKQRVIMSLYDEAPAAQPPAPVTAPAPEPVKESEVQPVVVEEVSTDMDVTKSPVPAPEFEPAKETEEKPEPELGPDSEIIYAPSEPNHATPEVGAVLGEVINRGVQTLGETLAVPHNTISEAAHRMHIDDLRAAIGINDRFLLVRDLFDGDAEACDATIDKLNSFDDLDDCMIYIAEHYAWNPNSDGAKLLVELLERKLI